MHEDFSRDLMNVGMHATFYRIKSCKIRDIMLSASFFRLPTVGYRKESEYIDGLIKVIKVIEEHKNIYLRLYIDNSIFCKESDFYDSFIRLFRYDNVEIILYSFLEFQKDVIYSEGLFGTLIRFIPLFYGDPKEIVYTIDIDFFEYSFLKNDLKNKNCDISIRNYQPSTIETLRRSRITGKDNIMFMACFILCRKKTNKMVFINFLKCLNDKCEALLTWNKKVENFCDSREMDPLFQTRVLMDNKHFCNKNTKLKYGIDEFFLNDFYFDYIIKKGYRIQLGLYITYFDYVYLIYKYGSHELKDNFSKYMDNKTYWQIVKDIGYVPHEDFYSHSKKDRKSEKSIYCSKKIHKFLVKNDVRVGDKYYDLLFKLPKIYGYESIKASKISIMFINGKYKIYLPPVY